MLCHLECPHRRPTDWHFDCKAQLRIVLGTYSFPEPQANPTEIRIPICYKEIDNDNVFAPKNDSAINHHIFQRFINNPDADKEKEIQIDYYQITQTTQNTAGASMDIEMTFEYFDYTPSTPGALNITGRWVKRDHYLSAQTPSWVRFQERTTPHNIDFDIQDYWQLIYAPGHHHFIRHFAVLFDEPIEGACGLMVPGVDPWMTPLTTGVSVHTIDCDINSIDELTLTDVTKQ